MVYLLDILLIQGRYIDFFIICFDGAEIWASCPAQCCQLSMTIIDQLNYNSSTIYWIRIHFKFFPNNAMAEGFAIPALVAGNSKFLAGIF